MPFFSFRRISVSGRSWFFLFFELCSYLFLFSLFHWVSCPDFFFFSSSSSSSFSTFFLLHSRPQWIEPGQGLPPPLSSRPPPSAWLQKILCEILSASRYRPGIFYEMYNLAGCTTVSRNLPSFEATRKRDFLKGITAFLRFLWYSMVHTINEYIYTFNGVKNYQHNLYNLLFQNWVWKN